MKPTSRAWLSAIVATPLLAMQIPAFAQSTEDRAAARATAQMGLQAMEEKRWADAVDLFTRAESLAHAPTILLYLARSDAQIGKLVEAQEAYMQVAHETLPPNASQPFVQAQADAQKELEALRPRIPVLTITVANAPPSLAVTMDSKAVRSAILGLPFPVNPGEHTLRATADGMTSSETKVSLKEGGHESAKLELVPLPPSSKVAAGNTASPSAGESSSSRFRPGSGGAGDLPSPAAEGSPKTGLGSMQIAGIATGAAGVVGIALGAVFGAQAFSAKSQQLSDCGGPGACPNQAGANSEHKDAGNDATISTVAFVAGGLLAAGGATLFFVGRPSQERRGGVSLSVTPVLAPGVGFGSLRGEF
jgi:hypothetical protein